ncbi:MAG TPA: serine hydrolase domain-containing protein [Steroidobacteraceae bacterium]|nr:serine hydrolase domain-containing protein [Steroidobacteraceae bacterium]
MMVDVSRRSFVVGAGLTAACIASFPQPVEANPDTSKVEAPADLRPLIENERKAILAAMSKEDIPGVGICLIYEGKPVWVEGFGVTDHGSNRTVTDSTIFNVESTSKNFTATAIMLAVQRGLLDLDEPITTYVPDFTVQSRFESAPESRITLRLLLSHRAGFTHEAPIGNNFDPTFADFASHVRSISGTWLRFPVGDRYRYSNLGVDLAGYILQVVSKMPFENCLKTMLFEPLGMSDSTAATDVYRRRADRAVGHQTGHATVPLEIPLLASGGVYISARDIAAYLMFHLNQGRVGPRTVLEADLWREMHGFSLGGNYGLGIARSDLRYGDTSVRQLSHNGGGFGFGCALEYYPESQLARAVFFNQDLAPSGPQFGAEIIDQLLSRRYGARKPKQTAQDLSVIEPTRKQLEQFVGTYVGRIIATAVEMKIVDNRLGLQLGPVFAPMQFTSPVDVFSAAPTGDVLTSRYFPGSDGQVAHFECAVSDFSFDYNDGPHDPFGPNEPGWERFLGAYKYYTWGQSQPDASKTLHRKNGYLYLDDIRLVAETEPGLFFTSDGEALDFRHPVPTWKNIRLERV